ncbi:MAG: anti-sigma factor, partial [Nocardioides sp.]
QPPAGLRGKVLGEIATVRPLPPSVERPTADAAGRRTRFRPRALLAAAAAVIALGAGTAVVQPWDDDPAATPTAVERVAAADDATTYTQQVGEATATLVVSEQLNEAVLVTTDMPEAPEGKVYELWLDHEGVGMVPAGLMEGDESEVVLDGDPATAIGFGITVEPVGGSEEPTSEPVAQIAFENA